nr:MAG: replication initiator protein [Microvirus sp.]
MCLTPSRLKVPGTDRLVEVACRNCRRCRDARVSDLVGRCIAEQCSATKSYAVTLTYGGGDTPQSVVLRYSDVQKFLKRLRKAGYKVRYICAGEYGGLKGRTHWHIVLFFYGKEPQWFTARQKNDSKARFHIPEWDHGFCYFQNADVKGFRYIMKYALKAEHEGSIKALSMSKKPPLGNAFFKNLADDLVERRLPVHSPEYSFAHVTNHENRPLRFWLQGRMRELFLDRYYTMWRMQYGCEPPWSDFILEGYLDKIERLRMADDPQRFDQDKMRRDAEYEARNNARRSDEFWQSQSEKISLGYLVFAGTRDLVQAYSNDSAEIWIGDRKWQVTAGSVTVADQLQRGGLPKSKVQQVSDWLESQWRNHRHLLQKHSPK